MTKWQTAAELHHFSWERKREFEMVPAQQCGLNRAELPQSRAPTAKDKDSQTVPGGIHPRFEITIPKCLSWAPTRFILWSNLSLTSPRWHVNLSKHLLTTLFFAMLTFKIFVPCCLAWHWHTLIAGMILSTAGACLPWVGSTTVIQALLLNWLLSSRAL